MARATSPARPCAHRCRAHCHAQRPPRPAAGAASAAKWRPAWCSPEAAGCSAHTRGGPPWLWLVLLWLALGRCLRSLGAMGEQLGPMQASAGTQAHPASRVRCAALPPPSEPLTQPACLPAWRLQARHGVPLSKIRKKRSLCRATGSRKRKLTTLRKRERFKWAGCTENSRGSAPPDAWKAAAAFKIQLFGPATPAARLARQQISTGACAGDSNHTRRPAPAAGPPLGRAPPAARH